MTLTLHNPLTEEEWDIIEDVDFDHTNSITFHTKHGKEVEFVKRKTGRWIYSAQGYTCSECKTQFPSEVHYLNPEYTLPKYCPECGARLEDETDG